MIPKIALWSLLGLGLVFIALFFFGGSNGSLEVAGDFLDIPRFTDAFLVWVYILLGIVVLITLGVVVVDFANNTNLITCIPGERQPIVTCRQRDAGSMAVLLVAKFITRHVAVHAMARVSLRRTGRVV